MLALIDLRLRQCFDSEKPFGGLHIILMGDMFQFSAIGRKFKKATLYQAAVLCSRNRKLPNKSYRDGANLFMKFRLLKLKGQGLIKILPNFSNLSEILVGKSLSPGTGLTSYEN